MSRPHSALIELAAGRPMPAVDDLDELIQSAVEHRMGGLLLSRVQEGEFKASGEWLHALARQHLSTLAHQQRLWTTLQAIVERLRDGGFDIATVKGLSAQARWYDHAGERPCRDIDLLVNPTDILEIEKVVRLINSDHVLLPEVRSLVTAGRLDWIDIEMTPDVWIDLHMDVFKLGIPALQRCIIWEHSVPFALPNGGMVRVFDPEISLIHLLIHLSRDRFPYLLGFVDVARILEREDLDWNFIDRFLRREGLDTPVYLALETVLHALGLPPAWQHSVRGWRAQAWRTLWPPRSGLQGDAGATRRRRRQFFLPFLVRGRGIAAFRWWLRRVFPPRVLVDKWYGANGTPYLWRLTSGRVKRRLQEWSTARRSSRPRKNSMNLRGQLGAWPRARRGFSHPDETLIGPTSSTGGTGTLTLPTSKVPVVSLRKRFHFSSELPSFCQKYRRASKLSKK
jgi:Uncharacterised nucleotidyltransferase